MNNNQSNLHQLFNNNLPHNNHQLKQQDQERKLKYHHQCNHQYNHHKQFNHPNQFNRLLLVQVVGRKWKKKRHLYKLLKLKCNRNHNHLHLNKIKEPRNRLREMIKINNNIRMKTKMKAHEIIIFDCKNFINNWLRHGLPRLDPIHLYKAPTFYEKAETWI